MLFKKVEMKNRVSLEGYGEILAGRIARPYEKGTPRAKQGDEYWFFIKHFASISREKASRGREGWRQKERERKKERGSEREEGGRTIFALLLHTVKSKKKTQGEFDVMAAARRADTSGSGDT